MRSFSSFVVLALVASLVSARGTMFLSKISANEPFTPVNFQDPVYSETASIGLLQTTNLNILDQKEITSNAPVTVLEGNSGVSLTSNLGTVLSSSTGNIEIDAATTASISGSTVELNSQGTVAITSSGSDATLEAAMGVNMVGSGALIAGSAGGILVNSQGNIQFAAENDASIHADGNFFISGTEFDLESQHGSVSVDAGDSLFFFSNDDMNILTEAGILVESTGQVTYASLGLLTFASQSINMQSFGDISLLASSFINLGSNTGIDIRSDALNLNSQSDTIFGSNLQHEIFISSAGDISVQADTMIWTVDQLQRSISIDANSLTINSPSTTINSNNINILNTGTNNLFTAPTLNINAATMNLKAITAQFSGNTVSISAPQDIVFESDLFTATPSTFSVASGITTIQTNTGSDISFSANSIQHNFVTYEYNTNYLSYSASGSILFSGNTATLTTGADKPLRISSATTTFSSGSIDASYNNIYVSSTATVSVTAASTISVNANSYTTRFQNFLTATGGAFSTNAANFNVDASNAINIQSTGGSISTQSRVLSVHGGSTTFTSTGTTTLTSGNVMQISGESLTQPVSFTAPSHTFALGSTIWTTSVLTLSSPSVLVQYDNILADVAGSLTANSGDQIFLNGQQTVVTSGGSLSVTTATLSFTSSNIQILGNENLYAAAASISASATATLTALSDNDIWFIASDDSVFSASNNINLINQGNVEFSAGTTLTINSATQLTVNSDNVYLMGSSGISISAGSVFFGTSFPPTLFGLIQVTAPIITSNSLGATQMTSTQSTQINAQSSFWSVFGDLFVNAFNAEFSTSTLSLSATNSFSLTNAGLFMTVESGYMGRVFINGTENIDLQTSSSSFLSDSDFILTAFQDISITSPTGTADYFAQGPLVFDSAWDLVFLSASTLIGSSGSVSLSTKNGFDTNFNFAGDWTLNAAREFRLIAATPDQASQCAIDMVSTGSQTYTANSASMDIIGYNCTTMSANKVSLISSGSAYVRAQSGPATFEAVGISLQDYIGGIDITAEQADVLFSSGNALSISSSDSFNVIGDRSVSLRTLGGPINFNNVGVVRIFGGRGLNISSGSVAPPVAGPLSISAAGNLNWLSDSAINIASIGQISTGDGNAIEITSTNSISFIAVNPNPIIVSASGSIDFSATSQLSFLATNAGNVLFSSAIGSFTGTSTQTLTVSTNNGQVQFNARGTTGSASFTANTWTGNARLDNTFFATGSITANAGGQISLESSAGGCISTLTKRSSDNILLQANGITLTTTGQPDSYIAVDAHNIFLTATGGLNVQAQLGTFEIGRSTSPIIDIETGGATGTSGFVMNSVGGIQISTATTFQATPVSDFTLDAFSNLFLTSNGFINFISQGVAATKSIQVITTGPSADIVSNTFAVSITGPTGFLAKATTGNVVVSVTGDKPTDILQLRSDSTIQTVGSTSFTATASDFLTASTQTLSLSSADSLTITTTATPNVPEGAITFSSSGSFSLSATASVSISTTQNDGRLEFTTQGQSSDINLTSAASITVTATRSSVGFYGQEISVPNTGTLAAFTSTATSDTFLLASGAVSLTATTGPVSLQSGTQVMIIANDPENANIDISASATITLANTNTLSISNTPSGGLGSTITWTSTGALSLNSATLNFAADGDFILTSTTTTLNSNAYQFQAGDLVSIHPATSFPLTAGTLSIVTSSYQSPITLTSTGAIDLNGGIWTINAVNAVTISSGAALQLSSSGDVRMTSGTDLTVTSLGPVTVQSAGVTLIQGSGIDRAGRGVVDFSSGGAMSISSVGTFTATTGSTISFLAPTTSLTTTAGNGLLNINADGVGSDVFMRSAKITVETPLLNFFSGQRFIINSLGTVSSQYAATTLTSASDVVFSSPVMSITNIGQAITWTATDAIKIAGQVQQTFSSANINFNFDSINLIDMNLMSVETTKWFVTSTNGNIQAIGANHWSSYETNILKTTGAKTSVIFQSTQDTVSISSIQFSGTVTDAQFIVTYTGTPTEDIVIDDISTITTNNLLVSTTGGQVNDIFITTPDGSATVTVGGKTTMAASGGIQFSGHGGCSIEATGGDISMFAFSSQNPYQVNTGVASSAYLGSNVFLSDGDLIILADEFQQTEVLGYLGFFVTGYYNYNELFAPLAFVEPLAYETCLNNGACSTGLLGGNCAPALNNLGSKVDTLLTILSAFGLIAYV